MIASQTDRGEDLPLSVDMQAFFKAGNAHDSIQSRIVQAGLRLSQVEPEIEALAILGTHFFVKANRSSVFTPTKRGGKTTDLQRIASWKQRLSTECVWTAVGIKPMVDVIQFDLCARDELENLEAIIKDYRIGELKRVAHSMAQKVDSLIGVTREFATPDGLPTHVRY